MTSDDHDQCAERGTMLGEIDAPSLALSVRQPWAWAILNAGKDIENRAWSGANAGLKFRGRVAIHASAGMTRYEYEEAREWIDAHGYCRPCPDASALIRGAICGSVEIVDVVSNSDSRWFLGPRGLVLANPVTCSAIRARGALGYFAWARDDTYVTECAKWMLPQPARLDETVRQLQPAPDLFGGEG